mmetsp:Transcript_71313/g.143557  ORF Transcript_71313/g.143557 Transcript_71313/m.143557 type:complete len:388 (-) Transcript_71313:783-1946(-)
MESYQAVDSRDAEKAVELKTMNPAAETNSPMDVVLGDEGGITRRLVTSSSFRDKELNKWERIIEGASNKAPPALLPCIKGFTPCFSWSIVCIEVMVPCYIRIIKALTLFLAKLPQEELGILLGLVLCFFGGMFPLTLAAAEAWRQFGGTELTECLALMNEQFMVAHAASEADDLVDDDNDGIPDVLQINAQQLATRKGRLVLTATDPSTLNKGFQGLYTAWVAIIGVLKLQFAKTIALGSAIGDFLVTWMTIPCTNLLSHLLSPDIHKWIPVIITYACKVVAITLAYQIQRVISAFYSAIRGGLLITRNFLRILTRLQVPFFKDLDPDDTYADEVAGWALAGFGFYCQLMSGFNPPWVVGLVLWPLEISEATLLWAIASPSPDQTTG